MLREMSEWERKQTTNWQGSSILSMIYDWLGGRHQNRYDTIKDVDSKLSIQL